MIPRLTAIALSLALAACVGDGRVPTDEEAPAMSAEEYAEFRHLAPLVSLALQDSPALWPAVTDMARENVAAGRANDPEAEADRISRAVARRAAALREHHAMADCYRGQGSPAIPALGFVTPIVPLATMAVMDARRTNCLRGAQITGAPPPR